MPKLSSLEEEEEAHTPHQKKAAVHPLQVSRRVSVVSKQSSVERLQEGIVSSPPPLSPLLTFTDSTPTIEEMVQIFRAGGSSCS